MVTVTTHPRYFDVTYSFMLSFLDYQVTSEKFQNVHLTCKF